MKSFWDNRYSQPEFAYGELPNEYLKAQLGHLLAGSILFPAEGEGRNAVYAATLGWAVYAFDQSSEAQKKARQLAEKHQVNIHYAVGALESLEYAPGQFDAIALVFAHFPADLRQAYHRKLAAYLRPGGTLILEGFSKHHIVFNSVNENAGGPRDIHMLFSVEEIRSDFAGFEIIELAEEETDLHEGLYHNGRAAVIRFVGRKK